MDRIYHSDTPRWAAALQIPGLCVSDYARRAGEGLVHFGQAAQRGASKVSTFVQENWHSLLAYAIAWGVILTCIGMMHGFKATSSPFSIGMGAGIGLGGLTGVLCVKVLSSKNSIGGRISGRAAKHLDYTTRQIALTVFVAVYLVAASRIPHGIGAISGLIIGDHLITKFLLGKDIIKQARTIEERLRDVELRQQLQEADARRNVPDDHQNRQRSASVGDML